MDQNVRAEIDGHLSKAEDKLRSAEVLAQAGQNDDAIEQATAFVAECRRLIERETAAARH